MERPPHDQELADKGECLCFKCHIQGLTIGLPKDYPSRTWRKMKRRETLNSWERGIPTDSRGMPWLDATGAPMGAKKVAENRHSIAETARRRKNAAPQTP